MSIYFTSDLHIGHDKDFLYEPRGFKNIKDHDLTIVNNWNSVVTDDDDIYILGDLTLEDYDNGLSKLKLLKGKKHIIIGNHDTNFRVELYKELTDDINYADLVKYGKYQFYISHYPTHTGNKDKHMSTQLINLYGHTHQKTNFYNNDPFMYHVGLDSHNNFPVEIDEIISDIQKKKSGVSKDEGD